MDERARRELYRALARLVGTETAATLMDLLPPVAWPDLATKDDVQRLEAVMEARFTHAEARVDARFAVVDRRFDDVDARFARMDARFASIDETLDRLIRRTGMLTVGVIGGFSVTALCVTALALTR